MSHNQERVQLFKKVWSRLRVPVRPGPKGLELYRAQMEGFPERDILAFGGTPELVDMTLEVNAICEVAGTPGFRSSEA